MKQNPGIDFPLGAPEALSSPQPANPEETLVIGDDAGALGDARARRAAFGEGVLTLLRRDRALQILVALTLLVNLALLAYLAVHFESLPDRLPMHFDATGLPDRIDARTRIYDLPVIGLFVILLNAALGILVHRRQRAAAIILIASALVVQILMWLAAINIAGGLG